MAQQSTSFADQPVNFAMAPTKKIVEQPKVVTAFPKTFQTFMAANHNVKINFAPVTSSKLEMKQNDDLSESSEDEGERTPPKRMVQQRGMFSGFQNDKLSFKHKVFAEDKLKNC